MTASLALILALLAGTPLLPVGGLERAVVAIHVGGQHR